MSTGLLFDCDDQVVAYIQKNWNWNAFKYDRALGLIVNGVLKGAVLFHCYNGSNVELSYYGNGTMTAGIVRCLARFILTAFNPSRLTVLTSKRNKRYIRSFQKLGFRLEGIQRCYYGHRDCNRNAAVRFVMFRSRISDIANLSSSMKRAS